MTGVRTPEYQVDLPREPNHAMVIELRNERGARVRGWKFVHPWWIDEYGTSFDWSEVVAFALSNPGKLFVRDA